MGKTILPLWAVLLLLLSAAGCGQKPQTVRDFMLNTEVYITVYRHGDLQAAEEALQLCRDWEKVFSRTDPDSELSRLNKREIETVSDELAEVIALGLSYGEISGGLFDITMGAVTDLWDFASAAPSLPNEAELESALGSVDWQSVSVKYNTVTFKNPDTVIDLGAVAKGWIADRLAEHLTEQGVGSAIISLGGNLYFLGSKPDGSPYQAGIQYPYQDRTTAIGGLPVREKAVVTSGVYERCFAAEGELYHHILDPETGYSARSDLTAVTIVDSSSARADILSTVCFLLGLEESRALIEGLEGTEAIFITSQLEVEVTSGLEESFYRA